MNTPPRIGLAYLFATDSRVAADGVFTLGGLAFGTQDAAPVTWVCKPAARINRRLYDLSRVSNADVAKAPPLAAVLPDVQAFFSSFDYLFVFSPDHEQAAFEALLPAGTDATPVLINLHTMAAFFLPDHPLHDLEALVIRALPEAGRARSAAQLPYLLRAFERLLAASTASGSPHTHASRAAVRPIGAVYAVDRVPGPPPLRGSATAR